MLTCWEHLNQPAAQGPGDGADSCFALNGKRTRAGATLRTNEEIRRYLLHRRRGWSVVPFHAFGGTDETRWLRLSVGAVSVAEIERVIPAVRKACELASL